MQEASCSSFMFQPLESEVSKVLNSMYIRLERQVRQTSN